MMNRAQRRAYEKRIRHDPAASICPQCGHKSKFYTAARGEKDTVIKCEYCDAVVREGEDITKAIPPGIYIPNKLDVIDEWLKAQTIAENAEAIIDNLPEEDIEGEEIK
jgi:transcription elongation factor Elf1